MTIGLTRLEELSEIDSTCFPAQAPSRDAVIHETSGYGATGKRQTNHASYHHHLLIRLYVNEALIILSFNCPAPVQSAAKLRTKPPGRPRPAGAGRTPANLAAH